MQTYKKRILIRVSDLEKRGFSEAAESSGMSVSAWIRDRLRHAAAHELEQEGRIAPFITYVGLMR